MEMEKEMEKEKEMGKEKEKEMEKGKEKGMEKGKEKVEMEKGMAMEGGIPRPPQIQTTHSFQTHKMFFLI